MAHSRLGWGSALAASLLIAGTAASHAASATGRGWSPGRPSATAPPWGAGASAGTPLAPSAYQTVTETVLGAGLTPSPAELTVVLHRQGNSSRFAAHFGPITVVDARGTLAGWTLFVSSRGPVPSGTTVVDPSASVAISGNRREVQSLGPTRLGASPVAIMAAGPGGGGGTFSDGGTVAVESPSASGETVTLHLIASAA